MTPYDQDQDPTDWQQTGKELADLVMLYVDTKATQAIRLEADRIDAAIAQVADAVARIGKVLTEHLERDHHAESPLLHSVKVPDGTD